MPLKMTQTKVKVEIRTSERERQNKESKSSIENAFQNTFISFFYSITNENKSAHPSPVRQKPLAHIGRMESLKVKRKW